MTCHSCRSVRLSAHIPNVRGSVSLIQHRRRLVVCAFQGDSGHTLTAVDPQASGQVKTRHVKYAACTN